MISSNRKQIVEEVRNSVEKFSKDTIVYGIAIIVPAFLGIISISLYTRIFSPNEYGEYNIVLNTTLLMTTIFSQWIQQSIQRYRPEYRNSLEKFERNLAFLLIIVSFVILGMGLIISLFRYFLGSYEKYYFISIILIETQFLYLTLGANLQSSFNSIAYKNFNLMNGILKFVFSLLIIFYIKRSPIAILLGLMLSQLILIYPMLKSAGLKLRDILNINLNEFSIFVKKFMSYGFPMIGWFLGTIVLNLCDRYMLQFFSSSKDVGIYSANYSIVSAVLSLLTSPLIMAAQPIIMNQNNIRENRVEIENIITIFSKIFLLITIPILFYVICFHFEMSSLLLGKKFRIGSGIIPILFAGILLWDLAMFGHKGFELLKKTKLMLLLVLFSAFLNIVLNFYLIPKYGYFGASIATLLSMAIYPLSIFIISKRYIIKWKLEWLSITKILFSSGISAVIVYQLKRILVINNYLIELLCGAIFGLLIYVILLVVTRVINLSKIFNGEEK